MVGGRRGFQPIAELLAFDEPLNQLRRAFEAFQAQLLQQTLQLATLDTAVAVDVVPGKEELSQM